MLKALGDLEAFDREAFVAAVCELFDDSTLVEFQDSYRLLAVVNRTHSP